MTQYPGAPYSGPTLSPPRQGAQLPEQPSSWPTVLGVIFIVLASLGIIINTCGGVFNAILPAMSSAATDGNPMMQLQVDIAKKYMVWNVIQAAAMLALGVLLLIGGIGLLRRRSTGVRMSRVWAIARLIWVIPASVGAYLIMQDTFAAMETMNQNNTNAQPMPAGTGSFMQAFGLFGVVIGVVMTSALPVFTLIWLSREKIKHETSRWP